MQATINDDDVSIGVTCPVHGEECPHSGCSHCLGGPSVLSLLLQGRDLSQVTKKIILLILISGNKLTLSAVYY